MNIIAKYSERWFQRNAPGLLQNKAWNRFAAAAALELHYICPPLLIVTAGFEITSAIRGRGPTPARNIWNGLVHGQSPFHRKMTAVAVQL